MFEEYMKVLMSIGTWVGGIAATVIAALVIWWFTHPGGILVEEPPLPKPILKILEFEASNVYVGEESEASFTVYNEGKTTAEHCTILWYSGSEVGKQLDQGMLPQKATVSHEFGLRPEETKKISMWSLIYNEPGEFNSIAQVECTNGGSEKFYKVVTVFPR
jgi:hypothetical protein